MKCLFVGPKSPDYLVSCVWDGLQEVLGEGNVVDAVDSPWLHKSSADRMLHENTGGERALGGMEVVRLLGASREGCRLNVKDDPYDFMVLASSFNRDRDWDWARQMRRDWVKPGGKVAYLEGWDAAWQVVPPEMQVDAVFRKEISRQVQYPYSPVHLTFAMPERLFVKQDGHRPLDLFWSGNPDSCHPDHPVRWPMLSRAFQCHTHHRSVMATYGFGFDAYFDLLRKTKLALCPSGADDTDSLRTMEAAACGAIPVFVGYPDHVRDPWFPPETCFTCSVDELPGVIDEALKSDLAPKRAALLKHSREFHTTACRARKILQTLGLA